jgi:hypothetical protein
MIYIFKPIDSTDKTILIFSMRSDVFEKFFKRTKSFIFEDIELMGKIERPKFTMEQFYREFYKERVRSDSSWFRLSKELLSFINKQLKDSSKGIQREGRKWTKEMIDTLRDNYPTKSKRWLREKLGLPWDSIKWKAWHLEVKRRKRTK